MRVADTTAFFLYLGSSTNYSFIDNLSLVIFNLGLDSRLATGARNGDVMEGEKLATNELCAFSAVNESFSVNSDSV